MTLKPSGGIVYVHAAWVSRQIRWLTRHRGEDQGFANHAFVLRRDGTGGESTFKGAVELPDYRAKYSDIKHWGVTFAVLTEGFDPVEVEAKLDTYIEEAHGYDYWVLAKAALDGLTGKLLGRDVFWFRRWRLAFWKRGDRWNICSWLYAWTHMHGSHRVHGKLKTFVGRVAQRRRWRPRIVSLYKMIVKPLELGRVTPNDIERDVFVVRPELYRITDEFGVRPADLPDRYRRKIERDLGF